MLDQQQPIERAFQAPRELALRLGRRPDPGALDPAELAAMDPTALAELFARPPALHRFPRSMAGRTQQLCQLVVSQYGGRASAIWGTAGNGAELLARAHALPGFGAHKAKVLVALLAKRLAVAVPGWEEAAGEFGKAGTLLSIADVDSRDTLLRYRAYKREKKAAARRS